MSRRAATCCDMVDVVGSNLKMVKLFSQHLWTLHDVVVVWPGSRNNVALGHATCRNTAQHGGQKLATFCIQQCSYMLRRNFAIVWLGLAKPGSTILRYVVLNCCDRLARALPC